MNRGPIRTIESGPVEYARHATLRAAIDWSWGLLDDDERRALAACAVFRGGFSAEAARAVLQPSTSRPVLSVVQALRDESLLRRIEPEQMVGHARACRLKPGSYCKRKV